MKLTYINNSILSRHFLNYQEMISINNKIISTNFSDSEIAQLYDKKYHLSEFDIYKYITAYDFIEDSLSCNKI